MTSSNPNYSLGEQIAHSVTHGVGVLLAIAGLTVLVAFAALHGDRWHVISCAIFGATLVLLYTASTLYHSIPGVRAKRVLQILDHSAIYLLIAGTYTPFGLVNLRGEWGVTLLAVLWGLAALGIVISAVSLDRFRLLSLSLYVVMGWSAVVVARPMLENIDTGGIVLLLAGGLAYTFGIVFYLMRRLPYHHMIWHLMVVAGSVLHFFAVLFYVIPRPSLS